MNFVLVHGAWHGAWCWHRLMPLLEAAGATVVAPDLPGHGADGTPATEVTLDAYADRVVAAVEACDGPVELVGHSMGGMVISAVAERIPDRLAGLTYVCAFMPRDGDVLGALGAEDEDTELNAAIRPGPEKGTVIVAPEVGPVFYDDCPEADAADALARLVPQPVAPLQTPVHVSEANFGRVPRAYVVCTKDRAVSPKMQRVLIERVPCDPVIELASNHSPFLSMPEELAKVLLQIAAGRAA